jgi:allantoinase
MPLPSHNRFTYSPIGDRPASRWPNGAGLAVYVAVAVEHFSYNADGLGLSYSPGIPHPNTYNWAWREYGNRVGAWRLLEALTASAIPPTVLLNTACYEHCPELVAAYRAAGAEIVAHGHTNSIQPNGLGVAEEERLVTEVRDAIAREEGAPPGGWMSPGANPSEHTEDLLARAGYRYTLDWPMDEQPVWMSTGDGPLLAVPYPHEVNDVPMIALHHASARDFADAAVDTVDELLDHSHDQALVCGIAVHGFLAGQPHRLRHLRRALEHIAGLGDQVWLTTPGAVAEHFRAQVPPARAP